MGVKRFDYILGTGPDEGWMEEAVLGQYIKSTDYEALAAQLVELRKHLGTLTPGGSHTCITCAAHCVVIGEMETSIATLKAALDKWALECPCGCRACTNLNWDEPLASETPVQHACGCFSGTCYRNRLKPNEYCCSDRAKAGLAQEAPVQSFTEMFGCTPVAGDPIPRCRNMAHKRYNMIDCAECSAQKTKGEQT